MQKDTSLNNQLYDAIVARFLKQPNKDWLRHRARETPDQSRKTHLIVWQETNEIDPHWEPWDIWIVVYCQLVEEGLINPLDASPQGKEYKLREYYKNYGAGKNPRIQVSNLALSSYTDNVIAFESTSDHHTLSLNLDFLALHLTKLRVEKLSLEVDPKWTVKLTSVPLLTSGVKLTTREQAEQLAVNLKLKVSESFKISEQGVANSIYVTNSLREPGVFRVVVKLEDLIRYCPPTIPDQKPAEDPFKQLQEARAAAAKKEESKAGDVIQSLDNFHLVLKIRQDSEQPVVQPQSPDQALPDNTASLDGAYAFLLK